ARELLVLASVLGASFSLDEIATVFPDDRAGIARRAEAAREAGLLEADDEPSRLRFVHGLIRQAAYSLADPHQQALLHLAAATVLGYGTHQADLEILRHLLSARPVVSDDDIGQAAVEAVGRSLVMGAHESAQKLV